jgi:hypothetical protein
MGRQPGRTSAHRSPGSRSAAAERRFTCVPVAQPDTSYEVGRHRLEGVEVAVEGQQDECVFLRVGPAPGRAVGKESAHDLRDEIALGLIPISASRMIPSPGGSSAVTRSPGRRSPLKCAAPAVSVTRLSRCRRMAVTSVAELASSLRTESSQPIASGDSSSSPASFIRAGRLAVSRSPIRLRRVERVGGQRVRVCSLYQ